MNPDGEIRGPGLYVHVPFCASKCAYCDFYSLPDGPGRNADRARYLGRLAAELEHLPRLFAPRSVYLGGGTPTALGPDGMRILLKTLGERVDLSRVVEFSCEANPGTLAGGILDVLRAGGVTRLSIGAQSFDPSTLSILGRRHSAEDTARAVRETRTAGFDSIGLDLIFAVPGQSTHDPCADLDRAMALGPDHLSLYALSVEPGTRLAESVRSGALSPVSDDEAADQFAAARDLLRAGGYEPYEISNYSRPGAACLQNLLYWSGEEYLGVGPSAHSHWNGSRWSNPGTLDAWADPGAKELFPREEEERLAPEAKAVETLVFGLRRLRGVQRAEFRDRTGFELDALRGAQIRALLNRGLLDPAPPDGIRLSESALFLSDAVFRDLL